MAEKKSTKGKATPRKRAAKPPLLCTAKLSDRKPCPKLAEVGNVFCHWHDPEDETWQEVYARLEISTREGKTNIVHELIEDHPEHRLVLPERRGLKANLSGANLQDEILRWADLEGANLIHTDLRGANLMRANLQRADLSSARLQEAKLGFANLQGAILGGANLEDADLQGAMLQGVELGSAYLHHISVFATRLDKTRMYHDMLGEAIGEELRRDYTRARLGYLALKQNFDDLGDYEAASWAYCKERRMEKLEARERGRRALAKHVLGDLIPKKREWRVAATSYLKYVSDTFVEWLCDYGESVRRVAGWFAALIFTVGPVLFSSLGGIVWNKELSQDYFALSGLPRFLLWYRVYLLYSLDTLTTASFSGLQPINDAVKLASGFFAIAGIVLAGLLGFVAGNRIRRS